jgi:hypothetical protein
MMAGMRARIAARICSLETWVKHCVVAMNAWHNVGTFDAQAFNEVRQNGAPAIGADGFAPPSLLFSVCVSANVLPWRCGELARCGAAEHSAPLCRNPGTDTLQDGGKRSQLVRFLLFTDASTQPIAPSAPTKLTVTSAAWNVGFKLAPDSLASGYGSGLAIRAGSAAATPLPVTLNGTDT